MDFIEPFRELDLPVIGTENVVIGDVIATPHEGVHRAQSVALPPWKHHKAIIEILGG
jgi:hypothetical protein